MKLPPLHALHCFECVGRKLSMKDAADELHVTAAAVSQQITKLEETIGIQLFIRAARRIELTDAGREYLRAIRPALSRIVEATEKIKTGRGPHIINLSCTNGFAMQWLLPRLARFNTTEPNIDICINTTNRLVDLRVDGIDFAVRHGLGKYDGLEVELLIDDDLQPVCSPNILPNRQHLISGEELKSYTLLHDEHRADWALWLEAVGAAEVDPSKGPIFVDSNGVIEAALAGRGVALVRRALVNDEIKSGRLATALQQTVKTTVAYYLVYDDSALLVPWNQRFRNWIVSEAAADRRTRQV